MDYMKQIYAEFEDKLGKANVEALHTLIPVHMHDALVRWIMLGIKPGDFLTTVLKNNLAGAVKAADDVNRKVLPNYVKFLYNYAPFGCWGSPKRVASWEKRGGFKWKDYSGAEEE